MRHSIINITQPINTKFVALQNFNKSKVSSLFQGIFVRDIYNRDQPYVGLWWFWRPVLLVNTPELARRILVKDCAVFKDRFLNSGKKDPLGGLNLFLVNVRVFNVLRTFIINNARLLLFIIRRILYGVQLENVYHRRSQEPN